LPPQNSNPPVEIHKHGVLLTGSGSVVADAEAALGDERVADELQVDAVAVRPNEPVDRRAAVLADQRRRRKSAIPGKDPHQH